MTYAEWKAYWNKIDWTKKWFAVFILIRPLVDNFYFLKEYSSFLSPLYIIGVLTPLLAVASIYSHKLKKNSPNPADEFMRVWGITILINCMIMIIYLFTLDNFGDSIKYITPILLFFYLRRAIQSREDLHFFLQAFLYSCIFPFAMLAFETFVHPIDPHYLSEGRGGGSRLRGEYGDSMSYAVYFIGLFMVYSYFFLDKLFAKKKGVKAPAGKLIMVFLACLGGIISIRHVSTWAVFVALIALLMWFNSRNFKNYSLVLFLGLVIFPFFARTIYEHQIYPLIAKEFNVINGDADIQYSFNGRMSRWERYFEIWNRMPTFTHLFGVSFSHFKEVPIMVGGGMHNDFVRLLFLTGIFGMSLYVIFLFLVGSRSKNFRPPERFLILSWIAILVLYSISTLPMIYLSMLNFIFPVFCFALLPKRKAYQEFAANGPSTATAAIQVVA